MILKLENKKLTHKDQLNHYIELQVVKVGRKDWDWMFDEITKRVVDTRDRTFEHKDENGIIVNRCQTIGSMGGSALDNEETYILSKMMRSLGTVYLETQARI